MVRPISKRKKCLERSENFALLFGRPLIPQIPYLCFKKKVEVLIKLMLYSNIA
jgi:hypothetical protein